MTGLLSLGMEHSMSEDEHAGAALPWPVPKLEMEFGLCNVEKREDAAEIEQAIPSGGSAGPSQPKLRKHSWVKNKVEELRECGNFDGWTALIAEIDRTAADDIVVISMVYDSFVSEYPLCHEYWIKYAAHKARHCQTNEVEKMYNDALELGAYSVPLWVGYCQFAEQAFSSPDDIRRLYDTALAFVGKDYLSYQLWDKYIEFENSQKQSNHLAGIYINTLKFPTRKLHNYFESFKELVAKLREQVERCNTLPLDKEYDGCANSSDNDDHFSHQQSQDKSNALKLYLLAGEQAYSKSNELDKKINSFEACIKRPYFHVSPLGGQELENWHLYLDFAESQGDFEWAVNLYERCLISCASYPEFWIRFVEFAESKFGREIADHAIHRALSTFLKRVPNQNFKFYCAIYKEEVGDITHARSLFSADGNATVDIIENVNRMANMEKRMKNFDAASNVYERAIETAKNRHNLQLLPELYSNYAKFIVAATGSVDSAKKIFCRGIQHVPCKSILKEYIQFAKTHGGQGLVLELDRLIGDLNVAGSAFTSTLSPEDHEDISLLYLEFLNLNGSSQQIRKALARHSRVFSLKDKNSLNNASTDMVCKNKDKRSDHSLHTLACVASMSILSCPQEAHRATDLLSENVNDVTDHVKEVKDDMIQAEDLATDDNARPEQNIAVSQNKDIVMKEQDHVASAKESKESLHCPEHYSESPLPKDDKSLDDSAVIQRSNLGIVHAMIPEENSQQGLANSQLARGSDGHSEVAKVSPDDMAANFHRDTQGAQEEQIPQPVSSSLMSEEQILVQSQSTKLADTPGTDRLLSVSSADAGNQEARRLQMHHGSSSVQGSWQFGAIPASHSQGYSNYSTEDYNNWIYYQQQLYFQRLHQNQFMQQNSSDAESQQQLALLQQQTQQSMIWQQQQKASQMQHPHDGEDTPSSHGGDQQQQQQHQQQLFYYHQQQQMYLMQQQQMYQQYLQQQMLQHQQMPQYQQDLAHNQQMQLYMQQVQLYQKQQMQQLQAMQQQVNPQGLQSQNHSSFSQQAEGSKPQSIDQPGTSCPSTPLSQRSNS